MNTRNIGNKGEDIGCIFLKSRGFEILARNYQRKWGEIDIVAQKKGAIHFFEVKSIRSTVSRVTDTHRPEENVHAYKLQHVRRMIETFLADTGRGMDIPFQFHVLAIHMNYHSRRARVDWIQDVIV